MSVSSDREQLTRHQYQSSYNDSHYSGQGSYYDDEDDDESSASILASVREQEAQFQKLTKEIEAERNTVSRQLQQSRVTGQVPESDSDNEEPYSWRQHPVQSSSHVSDGSYHSQPKIGDHSSQASRSNSYNQPRANMTEAYYSPNGGDMYVTENTTRHEDYREPLISSEVVVGDDGVERTVTKKTVTKTVTTHTTRRIDDYDGSSLPRSQDKHYSPSKNHRGSTDQDPLLQEGSSQNSSNSDLRPGHEAPVGYSRPADHRSMTPERLHPEEYGLPDDRQSDYSEEDDGYDLEPSRDRYNHYDRESSGSASPRQSDRYDPVEHLLRDEQPVAAPRGGPVTKAPLAEMEMGSQASLDRVSRPTDWRRPELKEVIRMLNYPMDVVQQNAAGYLQHLCFNDNNIKANVRRLDGIPPLVRLLAHENPKVQVNACGALRNLSFGPQNNENKISIRNCEGVPALVRLVRESKDPDVKEQATGTLWNLSAHKDLKGQILELAMEPLASFVIVPYSGWQEQQSTKPKKVDLPDILTNALGVIRNLSSHDKPEYRKRLRECDDLIDALVYFLKMNVEKEDVANKATENCVCILRNLTFQLYSEAPGADQYRIEDEKKEPEVASTSCFGKKKSNVNEGESVDDVPPSDPNARGYELLWQPDVIPMYHYLLTACGNFPETLEASAGAIQNLANGKWQWALYARAHTRKSKVLPILVDRLRTDNDRVIRSVSMALMNLSQDSKNKLLIGKYAVKDLVYKLPGSTEAQITLSDSTYIAVLNTVRVIVERSLDNARQFREVGGIERVTTVNNSKDSGKYHSRVVKAAGQVLKVLWDLKALHSLYKKDGWNKSHFTPTITYQTLPRNQKAMNNRPYDDAVESGTYPRKRKTSKEELEMNEGEQSSAEAYQEGPADSWV